VIASTTAAFEDWLMLFPEAIVSTIGTPPYTSNWGYVADMSSPGDRSALWLNIVWVDGPRPTAGKLYANGRFRELRIDPDCAFVSPSSYHDPGFSKQTVAPFGVNRDWPVGYPASTT
jgi:hypothetical protein